MRQHPGRQAKQVMDILKIDYKQMKWFINKIVLSPNTASSWGIKSQSAFIAMLLL